MTEYISIIVTLPTKDITQDIAENLVATALVACAQIEGPIQSVYRWEGKVNKDVEWRLVLKTVSRNFLKIEERIIDLHPYDIPQIIALPILEGHKAYLNWIEESVAKSSLTQ